MPYSSFSLFEAPAQDMPEAAPEDWGFEFDDAELLNGGGMRTPRAQEPSQLKGVYWRCFDHVN